MEIEDQRLAGMELTYDNFSPGDVIEVDHEIYLVVEQGAVITSWGEDNPGKPVFAVGIDGLGYIYDPEDDGALAKARLVTATLVLEEG